MYYLRLFHQSDPSRQIESRLIEGGELTVGRDPGVGWKVDDPDRAISRSHCVFSLSGGQLTVRDISSNGIFLGAQILVPGMPLLIELVILFDLLIVVACFGVLVRYLVSQVGSTSSLQLKRLVG